MVATTGELIHTGPSFLADHSELPKWLTSGAAARPVERCEAGARTAAQAETAGMVMAAAKETAAMTSSGRFAG